MRYISKRDISLKGEAGEWSVAKVSVSKMFRRAAWLFSLMIPVLGAGPARAERFVVFYGAEAPAAAFAGYQRAVLDSDAHPPLAPLKAMGLEVFGYLSLGEAERIRGHFAQAKAAGVLLDANPNWPGAYYVDLRSPRWRDIVLERLVPAILAQGFDGVFLDTLDDAAFLEQRDPRRFAGMTQAAADLIRAIRQRFPGIRLMLNRAYEIHDLVGGELDSVLGEAVLTSYDFRRKQYEWKSASDVRWQVERLDRVRQRNPAVRVFTLDYWNPRDTAAVAKLYRESRRRGYVPYVATIDLHAIIPEPAAGTAPGGGSGAAR